MPYTSNLRVPTEQQPLGVVGGGKKTLQQSLQKGKDNYIFFDLDLPVTEHL
jgi:hypothetical protein